MPSRFCKKIYLYWSNLKKSYYQWIVYCVGNKTVKGMYKGTDGSWVLNMKRVIQKIDVLHIIRPVTKEEVLLKM